jgi:uncharacterized protein (DUF362 family)
MTSVPTINRREFLGRCTRAGLSVAAAGALGIGFYDSQPPTALSEAGETVQIGNFSIADTRGKICIARGTDRAVAVRQAFEALGGMKAFVKPGERVLLKVNAAFASPPSLGATSHPDLVAAVVRLVHGCRCVPGDRNRQPHQRPGLLLRPHRHRCGGPPGRCRGGDCRANPLFQRFSVSGGRLIRRLAGSLAPLMRADRVIGLAPVKDHHRSGASMTLKNWYGLLGGRRNIFHQDVHTLIQELAMMIRPTVVVLDGIQSMMTNGPTGGSLSDLKPTGTLIVSTDPVAADAVGATLLGRTAADLPFIAKAAKRRRRYGRLPVVGSERDTKMDGHAS